MPVIPTNIAIVYFRQEPELRTSPKASEYYDVASYTKS